MIVTTTPTVEGRKVKDYLGIVTGETILGANFIKDFMSNMTDFLGGRSGAYEGELREAKNIALREMKDRAEELGADAILSVDIDYETLKNGNMLMVSCSGTGVKFE